jgi:hypothetical protein
MKDISATPSEKPFRRSLDDCEGFVAMSFNAKAKNAPVADIAKNNIA